jgi:polyvinyl alcohol dehydrogenase (cytochrome)
MVLNWKLNSRGAHALLFLGFGSDAYYLLGLACRSFFMNKLSGGSSMNSTFLLLLWATVLMPLTVGAAVDAGVGTADPGSEKGEALYKEHCEDCHGGRVAKAPELTLIRLMSASSVYRALDQGIMQQQAKALSKSQKVVLAEYLTGQNLNQKALAPAPQCEGEAAEFDYDAPPLSLGWSADQTNQRHYGKTITDIDADNINQLELAWAFAYPDAIRARSQPTVAGGAVYVGSQNGSVFALDRETGCIRWTFSTVAEVRNAIVIEPWVAGEKASPSLFFGDIVQMIIPA